MAQVQSIEIRVARKASAHFNTRDVGMTVVLIVNEGDKVGDIVTSYTKALQRRCDLAMGDTESATSFATTSQI